MTRPLVSLIVKVGSRVVAALLQAASLAILARLLGPASFGVFGQALSIGYLGASFLGFGLSSRALRLAAEPNAAAVASGIYAVRLVTASAVAAIVFTIFAIIDANFMAGIIAAAALLFAEMLSDVNQSILSGRQRQIAAAVFLLVQRSVPLAAIGIASFVHADLFIGFAVGNLIAAIVCLYNCFKTWVRPLGAKELIFTSKAYWLASLLSGLGQLDTTIVRSTVGISGSGQYAAASKLGTPLNIVTSSMLNVFVPELSAAGEFSVRRKMFFRIRRYSVIYATALIVASPVVAEVFVRILGPDYEPARLLMIAIVVAAALSGISQAYQGYLFASNNAIFVSMAVGIGTAVGLLALLVSGGLGGLVWLPIGPVVGQLTILTLFVMLTAKFERSRPSQVKSED